MSDPHAQLAALSEFTGEELQRLAAGGRQQAPEPRVLRVRVPVLPERMLSSNAGSRSRRDPWAVADSKDRLKSETMDAARNTGTLPQFDRCVAEVTLCHSNKKPYALQEPRCPRCYDRVLDGTYPNWAMPDIASKPLRCFCYRPNDVGNIGGEVLKPILDGLKWLEIMPDDDYTHLLEVTLRIVRVADIADECVLVRVTEIQK